MVDLPQRGRGQRQSAAARGASEHRKHQRVRDEAAEALGKIGSDKAVDALIIALGDDNEHARRRSVKALGKIGSDKTVDALSKALVDEYRFNSLIARESLGTIGSAKAVKALFEAWKISEGTTKEDLTDVLIKIENMDQIYCYFFKKTICSKLPSFPGCIFVDQPDIASININGT